jgi:hypothetical protein
MITRMRSDPRDDFNAFAGQEHMLFSLAEPYMMIREAVESMLRGQVADVVVERIATFGEPKFLTLGRKIDDGKLIVTAFAFAVSAMVDVRSAAHGAQQLRATVSFLFRDVDAGDMDHRTFLDLNDDAPRGIEELQPRFLAFRYEDQEKPA